MTTGYPNASVEDAVQADIVAAKYTVTATSTAKRHALLMNLV
jgi:hypothetical protein